MRSMQQDDRPEGHLGDLFHILSLLVIDHFEKASLKEVDHAELNRTNLNIMLLLSVESRLMMTELSRIHGISPSAVTKSIDHLEALHLVEREHTRKDRRIIWVRITPEGRRVVRYYRRAYVKKIEMALANLSLQERLFFTNILELFIKRGIDIQPDSPALALIEHLDNHVLHRYTT